MRRQEAAQHHIAANVLLDLHPVVARKEPLP
jgi:hypothetical protein